MPRKGTKRSDRRFIDARGQEWASELESQIYETLRADDRILVRKCASEEGDTFEYTSPIRKGKCLECSSRQIAQERTYTPDLYIRPKVKTGEYGRGYFTEIKGYWPASKRSLFRHFLKQHGGVDSRVILQEAAAYRAVTSSLNLLEYVHKYMKVPVHVWNGRLPDDWYRG